MKKKIFFTIALASSFVLGFAFNNWVGNSPAENPKLKRVTGVGGIFFKCKDPKKLKEWYHEHLGLNTNQYGTNFEWRQAVDSTKKGFTQWSAFKETTKYFLPSTKEFMFNYRVADLVALVAELRKENVTIVDTMEVVDYGKFIHIMDIEGNKIELWEPNDVEYDKRNGWCGGRHPGWR